MLLWSSLLQIMQGVRWERHWQVYAYEMINENKHDLKMQSLLLTERKKLILSLVAPCVLECQILCWPKIRITIQVNVLLYIYEDVMLAFFIWVMINFLLHFWRAVTESSNAKNMVYWNAPWTKLREDDMIRCHETAKRIVFRNIENISSFVTSS